MRVVVTGGAGFLGIAFCVTPCLPGVIRWFCLDNLSTGGSTNVMHLMGRKASTFSETDVSAGIALTGRSTRSRTSPVRRHLPTISAFRWRRWLWAAGGRKTPFVSPSSRMRGSRSPRRVKCTVIRLSIRRPRKYWGNVNPIGPRSVYDEAKRFAEALTRAFGCAAG